MAYDDLVIGAAANSKILEVSLRDSTTGQLKASVAYGSVAYSFIREGDDANKATGTCVDATLDAYTDHGWKETGIAGVYQFGVPQAALATGKNAVTIKLVVSGALDVVKRIIITSVNVHDGVRMGMTALPNAAANAASGLPIKSASGDYLNVANLPQHAAGATDGLLIAGSNAATTFASVTITAGLSAATISTSGAATFNSLVVSTTTTLTGNVTLSGTLGVGAVTFSSFTVTTTTNLTGAVTLGASLYVTTTTTLHGNVAHDGTTTYTGAVSLGSTMTLTGALTANSIDVGAHVAYIKSAFETVA